MSLPRSLRAAAVLGAAFLCPAAALAGRGETKGSGGGSPSPTTGKKVEVRWNPAVSVTVGLNDSIDSVLDNVVAAMNAASGGAYVATHATGDLFFDVLRADGGEVDDLALVEDDPGIQLTRVTLSKAGLRARIRFPEQDPTTGVIVVTLNGRRVTVTTTGIGTRAGLTAALLAGISREGFTAHLEPPYVVVSRDDLAGSGLADVGISTTDPAITSSEILLEAGADVAAGVPALGAGGLAALAMALAASAALLLRGRAG